MRKLVSFAFALASFSATAFPGDQHIAFERNNAVYVANLDGTNEKKIANGIFPAISPDGTRVAFNTVEKISDSTYVRHGAVRAQWKIEKVIPKGDMSGDGRIDVSPDAKRLLLSIDMGQESGRKDWDGPLPALWAFDLQAQKATRLTPKKNSAGTAFGSTTTMFFFSAARSAKKTTRFIECLLTGKI
jgi:Tol biopolymer transport system component